jgi:16S rRNA (uracil1498-N3)-methyltransferase
MSDRFYTPDPLGPGEYVLSGPDAHHLAAVRRFGPGDWVVLFNGDGREYPAEVIEADRKRTVLNILAAAEADRELPFPLVVASALPKGDRADFLVEKLTELGVTRFVPLSTTRAVVQPKGAKVEKFERAVIEASKQCGRNRLMAVDPPAKWDEFAARVENMPAVRVVLHPPAAEQPIHPLADLAEVVRRCGVVFAVGPEGGFTDAEVATAGAAGWRRVALGPRVLRVETAAVAAAAWAATLAQ